MYAPTGYVMPHPMPQTGPGSEIGVRHDYTLNENV